MTWLASWAISTACPPFSGLQTLDPECTVTTNQVQNVKCLVPDM